MAGSQTLGVRIPEHVLADVDRFAREQDLTHSMAIAVLVEQALSESGLTPSELPSSAIAAASGDRTRRRDSGPSSGASGPHVRSRRRSKPKRLPTNRWPMNSCSMASVSRSSARNRRPLNADSQTRCAIARTTSSAHCRQSGLVQSVQGNSATEGTTREGAAEAQSQPR